MRMKFVKIAIFNQFCRFYQCNQFTTNLSLFWNVFMCTWYNQEFLLQNQGRSQTLNLQEANSTFSYNTIIFDIFIPENWYVDLGATYCCHCLVFTRNNLKNETLLLINWFFFKFYSRNAFLCLRLATILKTCSTFT